MGPGNSAEPPSFASPGPRPLPLTALVGLRTNGSTQGTGCELMWTCSVDGGTTWSTQKGLGRYTHAAEGRRRPRIVAVGNVFYLFYYDIDTGKICLGKVSSQGVGTLPETHGAGYHPAIKGHSASSVRRTSTLDGRFLTAVRESPIPAVGLDGTCNTMWQP